MNDPEIDFYYTNIAYAYDELNKFENAIYYYEEALKVTKDNYYSGERMLRLSNVCNKNKNLEKAEKYYKDAKKYLELSLENGDERAKNLLEEYYE